MGFINFSRVSFLYFYYYCGVMDIVSSILKVTDMIILSLKFFAALSEGS